MGAYYFDTSALVKNYVREPGSTWVRQILADSNNTIFISQVALPEVGAALAILKRQARISKRERDVGLRRFLYDTATRWIVTAVTPDIAETATDLTQRYPLRGFRKIRSEARPRAVGAPEDGCWEQFSDTLLKGYDAVHLATALDLAKALHSLSTPLIFVAGDRQVLDAASAEGLRGSLKSRSKARPRAGFRPRGRVREQFSD